MMIKTLLIFVCGLIFGVGLAISGMLNPAKVVGFLDIFGLWDPSLAFVMGGGVVVNLIGHHFVTSSGQPLFAKHFSLPTRNDIDLPLIVGAAIFGIGWAMAGLCPGPAIASALLNPNDGLIFCLLMLGGIGAGRLLQRRISE
jgi:uncharacterized protein